MKFFKLLFYIIIIFYGVALNAQKIVLTIDKNVLGIGQRTVLHVKISNFSINNIPEIKNLENFTIQYIGTSSSISIINGKMNSEKSYNFLISPKKIGTFTIGPAIVKYKGKILKSNTIKVIVQKSAMQKSYQKYIFVELKANKQRVKVNEEVILTLKIYRKIDVTNLKLSIPEFKKAIVEKLGESKTYSVIINGQQYIVTEIKYSLFPAIEGVLKINPFILTGEVIVDNFDNFFKNPFNFQFPFSKRFQIASNSLEIKVEPLKKDVYAVGDYVISESIDKVNAKVGDTINLKINIKGKGNLKLSNSIKLPEIKGLKYYYDKPDIKIKKSINGIFSEKTEKIAIVPEKNGKFKIPAISLLFYNPNKEKYEILKIPSVLLKIKGEKEKLKIYGAKISSKNENLNYINEINTIYTDFTLENQNVDLNLKLVLIIILPVFLIVLLSEILYFVLKEREKNKDDILSKNAYKIFKKSLKDSQNIKELSEVLKDYFNQKFKVFKQGITFDEILILLKGKISEKTFKEIEEIFNKLEELLYSKNSGFDVNSFKDRIKNLIERIENEIKN